METRDAITSRRSVRAFTAEPVDEETVRELTGLAGWAPSSFNKQPWMFHAAGGEKRTAVLEAMAQTTVYLDEYLSSLPADHVEDAEDFFAELGGAPWIIAVSVPHTEAELERVNILLGAGGAIQNLQLAASDRGLGSCAITFSYWVRGELGRVYEIPEDQEIVSLVVLGVPAESPPVPSRRDDILDFLD